MFWSDDDSIATDRSLRRERLVGHRQISDAHLLLLARRHGGRLATFDRGVTDRLPAGAAPELVELLV